MLRFACLHTVTPTDYLLPDLCTNEIVLHPLAHLQEAYNVDMPHMNHIGGAHTLKEARPRCRDVKESFEGLHQSCG